MSLATTLRLLLGTMLLLVLTSLQSCLPPTEPKSVAETFLKSLQDRNWNQALALADQPSRSKLAGIRSIARNLDPADQAVVTGVGPGTIHVTVLPGQEDRLTVEWTLNRMAGSPFWLVRVDGAWRVSWPARSVFP